MPQSRVFTNKDVERYAEPIQDDFVQDDFEPEQIQDDFEPESIEEPRSIVSRNRGTIPAASDYSTGFARQVLTDIADVPEHLAGLAE